MINNEHKKDLSVKAAILLMAAVAAARGSSFIFSKQLLRTMEPLNLLGVRSLIAFGVLMLLFGRRIWKSILNDTGVLKAGALLGFLYFMIMTLELNALRTTGAATASFIENSAVVLVPLAEAMLRRKMPARITLISAGACLTGIGFITMNGLGGRPGIGELILIIAACIYTLAIIVTDRQSKRHDAFAVGILYVGFMGLFGITASLFTETTHLPQTGKEWLIVLALAILCSSFGFAMQPVAQRTLNPETTGLMTALNPLTTAVLGAIVLHETFGIMGFIGAALIITGILMHNLRRKECL